MVWHTMQQSNNSNINNNNNNMQLKVSTSFLVIKLTVFNQNQIMTPIIESLEHVCIILN